MILAWLATPTGRRIGALVALLLLGIAVGVLVASPGLRAPLAALLGVGGLVGAGAAKASRTRAREDAEIAQRAQAAADRLAAGPARLDAAHERHVKEARGLTNAELRERLGR